MFKLCWINVYVELFDVIVHNAEINFDNIEFKQNARTLSIQTKCVFIETANSIGLIKRYHVLLRRAYLIIIIELKDQDFIKEIRLQMTVKVVNDTIEYNNLVFTLLIFGIYSRIINDDASNLFIIEKVKVIKITMNEVIKLYIKKQTINALYQRNGPQIMKIYNISIDSSILIWRTHQKKWIELYKLLTVFQEIKTCAVELLSDSIEFRIIIVKPYLKESNSSIQDSIQDSIQNSIQDSIQNPIQDSIQNFIQSKNFVQSSKDNTSRRNPSRLR